MLTSCLPTQVDPEDVTIVDEFGASFGVSTQTLVDLYERPPNAVEIRQAIEAVERDQNSVEAPPTSKLAMSA